MYITQPQLIFHDIFLRITRHMCKELFPVSSTNKTDDHDITKILLNVALNTINQPTKTLDCDSYLTMLYCFRNIHLDWYINIFFCIKNLL